MADESPKQSFWTTLPGILTGIAAVLTAAGGIILGLHQSGNLGSKEGQQATQSATQTTVTERAAEAPPATAAANAQAGALSAKMAEKSSAEKTTQASTRSKDVIITETDGTVAVVYPDSFQFGCVRGVQLTTGQSIDFNKIRTVDVSGDDKRVELRITLANGEIVTGISPYPWCGIEGQNSLGSFNAPFKMIRRVTLPN